MNNYFDLTETLFDITERYPETIRYFEEKGFTALANPFMRKTMGGKISLEKAFLSKKLDSALCEKELIAIIEQSSAYHTASLAGASHPAAGGNGTRMQRIRIEGVLPCPIRLPLLERFEAFYAAYIHEHKQALEKGTYTISYDLQSANLGVEKIAAQAKTGKKEHLPDIILSAGFDFFFDKKLMGSFIERGDFHCSIETMNTDFCNDSIDLRDPQKNYAIIGVVPAVMVVNTAVLQGRKIPETWEEVLSPAFEHSVAVPFSDLDLFNSVVLTIYSRFGEAGIEKLKKACSSSLHPAQMVKAGTQHQTAQPAISISPYFFSKMIRDNSPLKAVWPRDGAIIAPIFMLVKKETESLSKPFADFFLSEATGTIFAQSGFLPSTNPSVDNRLDSGKKFLWAGWDFIYRNDIGSLLQRIRADFSGTVL